MAAATGLSGLIYAASGSLAYLAMAAMALAGLACALAAQRLSRRKLMRSAGDQRQVGYMDASSRPRRKIIFDDRPPRELIQRRRCGG